MHHSPPFRCRLFLDPDPNQLSRPGQISSKPYNPSNPSHAVRSVGNVGDAGTSDATTANENHRRALLRTHHRSSSTVQMLESALAAVRNDVSQIPLSDLAHASTMIRDLEGVLRERLARTTGDGDGDGDGDEEGHGG